MTKWPRPFVLGCIVGISAVALASAFLFKKEKQDPNLILYGNVDVRLVDIGFRVNGRVNQVLFEEGDLVHQGDLLAALDSSPYDAEVQRAAGAVQAISANLTNAEILLMRRQELIGVGGVSQEELDNAQADYDRLTADLAQAKAELLVNENNYAYTKVYAPTDGVILTRVREPGSVVGPADPVLTLSVASPVWVRAYVEEPDLGKVRFGMKALISTDTPGAFTYEGHVGFISPMAEFTPKTVQSTELRTDLVYRIRVYADNPDWRLKQGMPVTVTLKVDE